MWKSLPGELVNAFHNNDVAAVGAFLAKHSNAAQLVNYVPSGGCPAVMRARSVEMAQLLVSHGADAKLAGAAWKSGFNVNPDVDPAVGEFLVQQGASLSIHAAAGLGLVKRLRDKLKADPKLVHAPGGDGCTPLHFARTIETTDVLLDAGADINARDEDHDSTPAQWLIGHSAGVAAHLLKRGARSDIFLAAALGDCDLIVQHIKNDPQCIGYWIGKAPFSPIGHKGRGGSIYQWTLGFNSFPHQIAAARNHAAALSLLHKHSDERTQFLVACVTANREEALRIHAKRPTIAAEISDKDKELLPRYCWETNANTEAVRLMLDVGFPLNVTERSHGYTPLHNAAWGGYGDLVELLISRGHPVDQRDPNHNGTPLNWALHCCLHDGRHPEGEYPRVVRALLQAGSPLDSSIYPTGNLGVDEVLKEFVKN